MSSLEENESGGDSDVEMNEETFPRDTIENMLYFDRDMNTNHLLEKEEERKKREERTPTVKENYKFMEQVLNENKEIKEIKEKELKKTIGPDAYSLMTPKERTNYLFYARTR